jgi:hypothetical protein
VLSVFMEDASLENAAVAVTVSNAKFCTKCPQFSVHWGVCQMSVARSQETRCLFHHLHINVDLFPMTSPTYLLELGTAMHRRGVSIWTK